MKRKIINLFVILLLLAGVILLAYPYISFWLSERDQSYVVQQYDDTLKNMTDEHLSEEWERARAYNDALATTTLYDPFASGQEEMDVEYLSLLNIDENGVMCYVKIPKINVELPVYHGTSSNVLNKSIGHLEGSSLPVGGEGTHSILTGHTGLSTLKLFTDLIELAIGDEFYIRTLDQTLAYRVDHIIVIEPTETEALEPVPGKDYVTLITCTPYGVNSHRLLVRGERIEYTPEEIEQRIEDTDSVLSKETLLLYAGIALLVLLILVILMIKLLKRKRRKKV